jgi:hypothetical protein
MVSLSSGLAAVLKLLTNALDISMPACIQNHLKLQWASEEKQFKGNNTLSYCSDI